MTMNAAWNNLPKELLAMIFTNIHSQCDLLQLQSVCRNWRAVAFKRLYQTINILKVSVPLLVKTLTDLEDKARYHVKIIKVGHLLEFPNGYGYGDFLAMLRLCPNISHIHYRTIHPGRAPNLIHADISKLHSQGYLQHLQRIPYPIDFESSFMAGETVRIDEYMEAALALKKNLTHLTILNNRSNENYFQATKDFSRLQTLIVWLRANRFLFETLMKIDSVPSTLEELELNLENFNMAFERSPFLNWRPMLDLNRLTKRPDIRLLRFTTWTITDEDLQCIRYMFNGLRQILITVEVAWRDLDLDPTEFRELVSVNRAPSSAAYIEAFKYCVSLKHFNLFDIPVVYGIEEIITFWSSFSQVKTLNITESVHRGLDVVLLTVDNARQPIGIAEDNRTAEKHGWAVDLNAYYQDFGAFSRQTLAKFRKNPIEQISLCSSYDMEAGATIIGSSLDYIIDHYTTVKVIILDNTRISSFQADTRGNRLQGLIFNSCLIEGIALTKLSQSVQTIDQLDFISCKFLDNDRINNKAFTIDMLETSICNLNIFSFLTVEDEISYLFKVCTSLPVQNTQHLKMDRHKTQPLEEKVYEQMCIDSKDDKLQVQVTINCQSLQSITFRKNSHQLTI